MNVPSSEFKRSLKAIREMPDVLPLEQRRKFTIKEVRKGGYILLDSLVFRTDQFNRYSDGSSDWFELKLTCINNLKTVFLEWEIDDELEASLWTEKLKLRDLPISGDDLERFDDEEKGSFQYKGDTYHYDDSGDAKFYENNEDSPVRDGLRHDPDRIYYYDFEGPQGKLISVEEWLDDEGGEARETDVRLGLTIDPFSIEILIPGGSNE